MLLPPSNDDLPEDEGSQGEDKEIVSVLSILLGLGDKYGVSVEEPASEKGELKIKVSLVGLGGEGEAVFTESSFRKDVEGTLSTIMSILNARLAMAHGASGTGGDLSAALGALQDMQEKLEVIGGGKVDVSGASIAGSGHLSITSMDSEEGILGKGLTMSTLLDQAIELKSEGAVNVEGGRFVAGVVAVTAKGDILAQDVFMEASYDEGKLISLVSEEGSIDLRRAVLSALNVNVEAKGGGIDFDGAYGYAGKKVSLAAKGDLRAEGALFLLSAASGSVSLNAGENIEASGLTFQGLDGASFTARAGASVDLNNSKIVASSVVADAGNGNLLAKNAYFRAGDILVLTASGSRGYHEANRYSEVFGTSGGDPESILNLLSSLGKEYGVTVERPSGDVGSGEDELDTEEEELVVRINVGEGDDLEEYLFTESSFREDVEEDFDKLLGVLSDIKEGREEERREAAEEGPKAELVPEEPVTEEDPEVEDFLSSVIDSVHSLKDALEVLAEGGVDVSESVMAARNDIIVMSRGPGEAGLVAIDSEFEAFHAGGGSILLSSYSGDLNLKRSSIVSVVDLTIMTKEDADLLLEDSVLHSTSAETLLMAGGDIELSGTRIEAAGRLDIMSEGVRRGADLEKLSSIKAAIVEIFAKKDVDLRGTSVEAYAVSDIQRASWSHPSDGPLSDSDLAELSSGEEPSWKPFRALTVFTMGGDIFASDTTLEARGISFETLEGKINLDRTILKIGADHDLEVLATHGLDMRGLVLSDARNVVIETAARLLVKTENSNLDEAEDSIEAEALNADGAKLNYRGSLSLEGGDISLVASVFKGAGELSIDSYGDFIDISGAVLEASDVSVVSEQGRIDATNSRLIASNVGKVRLLAKSGGISFAGDDLSGEAETLGFVSAGVVELMARDDIEISNTKIMANAEAAHLAKIFDISSDALTPEENAFMAFSQQGDIIGNGLVLSSRGGVIFDAERGALDLTKAHLRNDLAYTTSLLAKNDIVLNELVLRGLSSIVARSRRGSLYARNAELRFGEEASFEGALGLSLQGSKVDGPGSLSLRAGLRGRRYGYVIYKGGVDVSGAVLSAEDISIEAIGDDLTVVGAQIFAAKRTGRISLAASEGTIDFGDTDTGPVSIVRAGLVSFSVREDIRLENLSLTADAEREDAAAVFGVSLEELEEDYASFTLEVEKGNIYFADSAYLDAREALFKARDGFIDVKNVFRVKEGYQLTFQYGDYLDTSAFVAIGADSFSEERLEPREKNGIGFRDHINEWLEDNEQVGTHFGDYVNEWFEEQESEAFMVYMGEWVHTTGWGEDGSAFSNYYTDWYRQDDLALLSYLEGYEAMGAVLFRLT